MSAPSVTVKRVEFRMDLKDGWPAVVQTWVPRLMPGLRTALFHGAIRTAHAVRAIDAADTEPRRGELARARRPGCGGCSTGPASSTASSPEPDSTSHPFCNSCFRVPR
ncbi:MAG TPA: hypothetical protein VFE59_07590 [Trebonia sp.]|nr:hypothetical protein [Trebonia sp.]